MPARRGEASRKAGTGGAQETPHLSLTAGPAPVAAVVWLPPTRYYGGSCGAGREDVLLRWSRWPATTHYTLHITLYITDTHLSPALESAAVSLFTPSSLWSNQAKAAAGSW